MCQTQGRFFVCILFKVLKVLILDDLLHSLGFMMRVFIVQLFIVSLEIIIKYRLLKICVMTISIQPKLILVNFVKNQMVLAIYHAKSNVLSKIRGQYERNDHQQENLIHLSCAKRIQVLKFAYSLTPITPTFSNF